MNVCLSKEPINKFLNAIQSGSLDVDELAGMASSEARREVFEQYVGKKAASEVNAMFESKLLLKNQERGMIDWIKTVGGLKEKTVNDLTNKIKKLDKVLSTDDIKSFKEDLISKKLGFKTTFDDVKEINTLVNKVKETEVGMRPDYTFDTDAERLAFGRAKADLLNLVNEIKNRKRGISWAELKENTFTGVVNALADASGLTKSIKFSLDVSVAFRQGIKDLSSDPAFWWKNTTRMLKNFTKVLGGKEVMRDVMAEILTEPNYLNGRFRAGKLAIDTIEDQFANTFAEKIPGLGRAFSASDTSFTIASYLSRVNKMNSMIRLGEAAGENVDDPRILRGYGKIANSHSGRGSLGALESSAGPLNLIFTSARFLKANIDGLTLHILDKEISPFARKQAAINLAKYIATAAGVLLTFKAMDPESVDFDPRSSDFGKIKVGNTRFDVTGGQASVVVLISRLLTWQLKSATTGKLTSINSGKFGSTTGASLIGDFFANKLSPVSQTFLNVINGHDRNGNPTSVGGITSGLIAPLQYTNYQELQNTPDAANTIAAMLADSFGISVNSFAPKKKKAK